MFKTVVDFFKNIFRSDSKEARTSRPSSNVYAPVHDQEKIARLEQFAKVMDKHYQVNQPPAKVAKVSKARANASAAKRKTSTTKTV